MVTSHPRLLRPLTFESASAGVLASYADGVPSSLHEAATILDPMLISGRAGYRELS